MDKKTINFFDYTDGNNAVVAGYIYNSLSLTISECVNLARYLRGETQDEQIGILLVSLCVVEVARRFPNLRIFNVAFTNQFPTLAYINYFSLDDVSNTRILRIMWRKVYFMYPEDFNLMKYAHWL